MAAQGPSGRRPAPPLSKRVVVVAAGVLGLTLAAVVLDSRRVRTGELLVQADAADVRVLIKQAGRVIVAPTGKRSFTLAPGEYDLAVEGGPDGARVAPQRVAVVRGRRAVVTVRVGP